MMPFNIKRDAWLERRLSLIQNAKHRVDTSTLAGFREAAVDTAIAMGGRFRDDWLRAFSKDHEMTCLLKEAFASEDES